MTDRRPLIVLAVFFLIVVVGAVGFRAANSAGTATSTATTQDQAPAATSSSTTPSTTANGTTEPYWQTALDTVIAGENNAFQKPNPSDVDQFMLPVCSCYTDTVSRLTNLEDHGWHVAGNSENIVHSALQSSSANSVTLVVQPVTAGNPTVDARGKVVEAAPTTGISQPFIYVLNKGSDGVWRVADRHLLPEQSQ